MLWVLLGCLGIVAASELYKRLKLPELMELSDEEFLAKYKKRFATPDAMVLEGRRVISKHLGIPYQKLSPDQNFERISKYTGFVTEYEVGISDLEDKLFELCEGARQSPPDQFPATVGEFIYELGKVTKDQP